MTNIIILLCFEDKTSYTEVFTFLFVAKLVGHRCLPTIVVVVSLRREVVKRVRFGPFQRLWSELTIPPHVYLWRGDNVHINDWLLYVSLTHIDVSIYYPRRSQKPFTRAENRISAGSGFTHSSQAGSPRAACLFASVSLHQTPINLPARFTNDESVRSGF